MATLQAVVSALTQKEPDLSALEFCGLAGDGTSVLFSRPPTTLDDNERAVFAAAGARGAAEGARRLADARVKFQRLAEALELVPDTAVLTVISSGQGEVKGRSVWERRGPAMLRGEMTVKAWARAVVVGGDASAGAGEAGAGAGVGASAGVGAGGASSSPDSDADSDASDAGSDSDVNSVWAPAPHGEEEEE